MICFPVVFGSRLFVSAFVRNAPSEVENIFLLTISSLVTQLQAISENLLGNCAAIALRP